MTPQPQPTLEARSAPGLSVTLEGKVAPDVCQGCSRKTDNLIRWLEHDAHDQPTRVVVVLCQRCSDRHIEPAARLYRGLDPNEPAPGTHAFCLACTHRAGASCGHPDAKHNGGPGLNLQIKRPIMAIICGGRGFKSGPRRIWPAPARGCSGRTIGP